MLPLRRVTASRVRSDLGYTLHVFEGVGSDDTSGVWENEPNVRPEFRAQNQKKLEKAARAAKAQEMI